MKKHLIIVAAMFTACLALCAAVWQQTEVAEETDPTKRCKRPRADR